MAFCISFLVCASVSQSQTALWRRVSDKPHFGALPRASLSSSQEDAIRTLLKARPALKGWICFADDPSGEWLRSLIFETLPLASNKKTVLVEAGAGCARGGQGSNGAMWIVQFNSESPVFLASPEMLFNGWLYEVQPTTSHGYRDIVLGWHMSAFESDLSYFRFDGRYYRRISSATALSDGDGNVTIKPNK